MTYDTMDMWGRKAGREGGGRSPLAVALHSRRKESSLHPAPAGRFGDGPLLSQAPSTAPSCWLQLA